jgi:putative tricarboxylic transport membrane protein
MRRADILVGAAAILLAGFVLAEAQGLEFFQRTDIPGPGFLPTLLAIGIGVIGLLLVVTRLVGRPERFGSFPRLSASEFGRSMLAWFGLLAAILLLDKIGFVAASAGLIAWLLLGLEKLRSLPAVLSIVLIPTVFYAIFALLLRVPLPTGPWGF